MPALYLARGPVDGAVAQRVGRLAQRSRKILQERVTLMPIKRRRETENLSQLIVGKTEDR
jgi:hypothetical protein